MGTINDKTFETVMEDGVEKLKLVTALVASNTNSQAGSVLFGANCHTVALKFVSKIFKSVTNTLKE